ncbi:nucleotidyltransferase domain-containing protein [Rubrivirga sp. S365]|uniref:Nucleotidyltransferase domain-containing protein n=1 Tax=Rubrivirga litoralis TaxID=3075598 RepID=A0ABU3BS89_9BACT|nr:MULTISPECIES: nucleotidyltransferase domain-containing protein [unclassified Rubrivirga]MDT0632152.1 nucleotidyltransferase domain-containing protein [Rubrivirga sp. F394]MDT7857044.1 nucleotidyltransferase domain-containing protein [Rubrivirga sp. S365]
MSTHADPAEDPLVRPLVAQIVAEFDPLRVVLFGSRAAGTARPDSDVDLLVVMPDGTPRRRAMVEIGARLPRPGVGIDLLVTTPAVLAQHGDNPGLVYREILRTGRTLYDAKAAPLLARAVL